MPLNQLKKVSWSITLQSNYSKILIFFSTRYFSFIAFLVLISILIFSLSNPSQAYFDPWDFYDSTFVFDVLRAKHVQYFTFGTQIPEVLGGLDLDGLGVSDFSLSNLLYEVLEPYQAIAVLEFIVRVTAFLGFYLFVSQWGATKNTNDVARGVSSLAFALTSWHPHLGPTIALQPLILWILISNLEKRFLCKSFAILLLTQNISFIFGGFLDLLLYALFIIVSFRKRISSLKLLYLITTLTLGFLVANIRLLHLIFLTDFESHRTSWPIKKVVDWDSFDRVVPQFLDALIRGIPHMGNPQSLRIFIPFRGREYWYFGLGIFGIISILTLLLIITSHVKILRKTRLAPPLEFSRSLFLLFAALIIIIGFYISEITGFTNFKYLSPIPWQFSRVAIIVPTIMCCIFAVCISKLHNLLKTRRLGLLATFLFFSLSIQVSYSYYPLNGKIRELVKFSKVMSISEYFQESNYQKLKIELGGGPTETITVLSYGLDPAVASFNGFLSLDGYSNNYSLNYKEKFRTIIRNQLARDPAARDYFDDWGSRAYLLFDGSYPFIDWCAASLLGAQYVLSKTELVGEGIYLFEQVGDLSAYRVKKCS